MRIFLVATVAMLLVSCASTTRGTVEEVQFLSTPFGAKVQASTGQSCVTPCSMRFSRKDSFTATFSKAGFEPQTVQVGTYAGSDGKLLFAENVVLGGVIGMAVDAGSAAAYDHCPNPVWPELKPLPGHKPPKPPAAKDGKMYGVTVIASPTCEERHAAGTPD